MLQKDPEDRLRIEFDIPVHPYFDSMYVVLPREQLGPFVDVFDIVVVTGTWWNGAEYLRLGSLVAIRVTSLWPLMLLSRLDPLIPLVKTPSQISHVSDYIKVQGPKHVHRGSRDGEDAFNLENTPPCNVII